MKYQLFLVASVLIALGAGIVIGRKTAPTSDDADSRSPRLAKKSSSDYRSARSSKVLGSSAHRGEGNSHVKVGNKVKHMIRLAEKLNIERGMPDFDALFGIWETARSMSPSEIKQALSEIDSKKIPMQSSMFMKAMLVMQWAKKDGQSAMHFALSAKNNHRFFPMEQMALQAWGSSDPTAAYQWYEGNKQSLKPRERKQFEAQAIAALAKDNFALAFQKAKAVDSTSRESVLAALGATTANNPRQRSELLAYVKSLNNPQILNKTGEAIARNLAVNNTPEAIQFVDQWAGADKSDIAQEVAEQWGRSEPAKAMEWQLNMLSEDDDRALAVEHVFAEWARRDPEDAKNWLSLRDDFNRDELRKEAIRRMQWDDDYPGAVRWVGEMEKEENQISQYRHIYSSWKSEDKESADKWLESQPEDLQKQINNR